MAAIRAHLGELVDQVVATMQAHLDDPDYVATLPDGALQQIQAVILVIQVNREAVISALDQLLDDGGANLPVLSNEMCGQVKLVFDQIGIPMPDGLCPIAEHT